MIVDQHGVLAFNPTFSGYHRQSCNLQIGLSRINRRTEVRRLLDLVAAWEVSVVCCDCTLDKIHAWLRDSKGIACTLIATYYGDGQERDTRVIRKIRRVEQEHWSRQSFLQFRILQCVYN